MFHTHVTTASGNRVDFDRASFLMDKDLLDDALLAVPPATSDRPTKVWRRYCAAHFERYGGAFVCDCDPDWDRPPPEGVIADDGG